MISAITAPRLARLFGCGWKRLELQPEGLLIIDSDETALLCRWDELAGAGRLVPGRLFHRLRLDAEPESRAIGWMPRWRRRFWTRFSTHLHQARRPLIEHQLRLIERELQRGYPRSSVWLHLSERAAAVLEHFDTHEAPDNEPLLTRLRALADGDSELLHRYREHHIAQQCRRFQALFGRVEPRPLTESQQRACVTDDDSNLVLAGAGSGKTSTLIGRTAYLIASGLAEPGEILLLAFGRQAANEMQQRLRDRLNIAVTATTFHALGQRIIATVEGRPPALSPLALDDRELQRWIGQQFDRRLQEPDYRQLALNSLLLDLYPNAAITEFETRQAYRDWLATHNLRTLKGEPVPSVACGLIANRLLALGIDYRLLRGEANDRDIDRFAGIHLPQHRLCIDLLVVGRDGSAPAWIDMPEYLELLERRRALCREQGQERIEIRADEAPLAALEKGLEACGVPLAPLADDSLLALLRERGLIEGFVTLLAQLLRRQRGSGLGLDEQVERFETGRGTGGSSTTQAVLQPLLDDYRSELETNGEIDFDDMIVRALQYVEQGRFQPPWRHILVDEFQDISLPRARLVRALREAVVDASLFAVGDDWQAIYRFTGSDLRLTTEFETFFGAGSVLALDRTFRVNDSINAIASRFVLQNPAQRDKTIRAERQTDRPAVSLHGALAADEEALDRVLEAISLRADGTSVLVLARHAFRLPKADRLAALQRQFPQLSIECLTVHAAKGREADFVVLLGLDGGRYGFPSGRQPHPLLEALLPEADTYPHGEERRLFYVALTRARHHVYLIGSAETPSPFVQELLEQDYPVEWRDFQDRPAPIRNTRV